MLYESASRLIDRLESRFGRFAFAGLLIYIAIFQVLVYLLEKLSPGFVDQIDFSAKKILAGEVWRLIGFLFLPQSGGMLLFFIIAIYWMFIINNGLESAWGAFRTNLYTLVTTLLLLVGAFSFYFFLGFDFRFGFLLVTMFVSAHFLAYCTLYSEQEILLLFVIPIKLKWVGLIAAAFLVLQALQSLGLLLPFLLLAHGAYLAVFAIPYFRGRKQSQEAKSRRQKFEAEAEEALGETFHECHSCGKTERNAGAEEEFRVAADGEEYCETCLNAKKQAAAQ
jgi:hypothetical protein